MAYVVIKYSVMEGNENTNQNQAQGGNSPISLTLSDGKNYSWGPNESKTLAEPFASEALAANNRLTEVSRS